MSTPTTELDVTNERPFCGSCGHPEFHMTQAQYEDDDGELTDGDRVYAVVRGQQAIHVHHKACVDGGDTSKESLQSLPGRLVEAVYNAESGTLHDHIVV
jgi:hypothetical protein